MTTTDTDANLGVEAATPRRSRARRGQGELLRTDILAAAERLLIETGDEAAVSIRAVAKAVGVTPPSIYLHFADKTELIFQVCQVHWTRFNDHLAAAVAGVEDPVDRLRACGRAYLEFGLANPEHYRILFMGKPSELPTDVDMDELMASGGFGYVSQAVGEAVAQGKLVGDPTFIVYQAWSMVHGLVSLHIAHADLPWPDLEALHDHCMLSMVRGLASQA